MNRNKIIKEQNKIVGSMLYQLCNCKYKDSKYILKDLAKLENAKKEIEIQRSYIQHEG